MASTLRDLFNTLSFADVQTFFKEGREEDLHLDFKLVKGAELKDREDRRTFARAVSGFGNSDGGLIVWGVDARKNEDGIDCACDAPGVAGVKRFVAKLNEYTGSVVNPTLVGIDHRPIVSDQKSDHGYVVTFVPVSDSGPHMAKLGDDRYYRRSGSNFVKMEHFEIADMFGRRPRPKLVLLHKARGYRSRGRSQMEAQVELSLENVGRGSARAPYLSILAQPPFSVYEYGFDGNSNHGLPQLLSRRDGSVHFGGSGDVFIHPGAIHPVTVVSARFDPGSFPDLSLEYEICAEGVPLEKRYLSVPGRDLLEPS
jgi:Putative DNA-binding domain